MKLDGGIPNIRKAQDISAESPSPFDQINELLDRGTLTVTIENSNNRSLLATHPQGESFSIAEMSDGERNAMDILGTSQRGISERSME